MVFIQIPAQLTEEEKLLQQKYQKLKRKKKALQQLRAPPKPEPVQQIPIQVKRSSDGLKPDAKEVAKKLLKSGAISAIKVPDDKDKRGVGFKRSTALERKRIGSDRPGGYQPYSSVHSQSDSASGSDSTAKSPGPYSPSLSPSPYTSRAPVKDLYESFVSASDAETAAREEANREKRRDGKANYVNRDIPNQGNTVYVHSYKCNELFLRTNLAKFGTILNISVETDKNCGFVTFESIDEANTAINEINEKTVAGVKVKASLARRQPDFSQPQPSTTATTTNSWSAIAQNFTKSSNFKDTRGLVSYGDADMFG